jgi:hypothetical protein
MVKTTNIDRFNKQRKEKNIVTGDCIFPFKYKGVLHNKCVEGKTGDWCATGLKPTNTSKTWAYCVKSKKNQYETAMVKEEDSSRSISDSLPELEKIIDTKDSSSSKEEDITRLPLEAPLKEHIQKALTDKGIPDSVVRHITEIFASSKTTFKDLLKLYEEGKLKENLIDFISEGRAPGIMSIKTSEFILKYCQDYDLKNNVKDDIIILENDINEDTKRLPFDSPLKQHILKIFDNLFMSGRIKRVYSSLIHNNINTFNDLFELYKKEDNFQKILIDFFSSSFSHFKYDTDNLSSYQKIASEINNYCLKYKNNLEVISSSPKNNSSNSSREKGEKKNKEYEKITEKWFGKPSENLILSKITFDIEEKALREPLRRQPYNSLVLGEQKNDIEKNISNGEWWKNREIRKLNIKMRSFFGSNPKDPLYQNVVNYVQINYNKLLKEEKVKEWLDKWGVEDSNDLKYLDTSDIIDLILPILTDIKAKELMEALGIENNFNREWLVLSPNGRKNYHDDIKSAFSDFKNQREGLIHKYPIISFEGMTDDEIEEKLPELSFVPVDIKTCDHDTSMIDYDEKLEDKSNKVIRVSNGNCYDIDEFVDYLIANNGKNVDPIKSSGGEYVTLWNSKEELLAIRNFPFVDKSKLKDFHRVLDEQLKAFVDKPSYIDIINSEKGKDFLNRLLITGKICTEDYTEDFTPSQTEITRTREYLQGNFTEQEIKELKLISTINGLNIDGVLLKDTGSHCIHGLGFRFCSLYFTIFLKIRETMELLGEPFDLQLFPGVVEVRPNAFMFCHSNVSSFTSVNNLFPLTVLLFDTENMSRSNTSGGTGRILKIPLKTGWKMWAPTVDDASPWGFSKYFCKSQIRVCEVNIESLKEHNKENILMQFADRPDKQKIKGPLSPVGNCKKEKKTAKKKNNSSKSSSKSNSSSGIVKTKKELTDEQIADMKARNKLPYKGDFITGIRLQDKDALKILLRARNIEAKLDDKSRSDSSSSNKKTLKIKIKDDSSSSSKKKIKNENLMKNILLNVYINLESLPGGGSRIPREIIKYLKEESIKYPEFWDADNVIGYIYRDEWSKIIEMSKKQYLKTEKIKKTVKKKNSVSLLTRYQSIPDKLKGETIFKLSNDKLSKECLNKTFILKNTTKVIPPGIHQTWSIKVTEVKKRYKINLEYTSRKGPVKRQYWWNPKKRSEGGDPSSVFQKEIDNGYVLVELKNN